MKVDLPEEAEDLKGLKAESVRVLQVDSADELTGLKAGSARESVKLLKVDLVEALMLLTDEPARVLKDDKAEQVTLVDAGSVRVLKCALLAVSSLLD